MIQSKHIEKKEVIQMVQNKETIEFINKRIEDLKEQLTALQQAKRVLIGKNRNVSVNKLKGSSPTSVGSLSMEVIKEAGKPLHVKDIVPKLKKRGKNATKSAVSIALHRLANKKILKKTYPNTFDLINNEKE